MPRRRTDPQILQLRGSRHQNASNVVLRSTEPVGDAPAFFEPTEKATWYELANSSQVVRRPDRVALEMAVGLVCMLREGRLSVSGCAELRRLLADLGMVPAARLKFPASQPDDAKNPFLQGVHQDD